MSANEDEGGVLRTVTPLSSTHEDQEMNVIGWVMFGTLFVVLLPLVPIVAAIWLVGKAMGR